LFIALSVNNFSFAQPNDLDAEKWAIDLSKKDNRGNETARKLDSILELVDSMRVFQFLNQLQEKGKSKGNYFLARFNCIKARSLFLKNSPYQFNQPKYPANLDPIKVAVKELFSSAINIAYESEDDYLVAFVSYNYATIILRFGETGISIMYAKNSVDLYEKLSYNVLPAQYQFLAEMLFTVQEYNDCIKYGKKAASGWQKSSEGGALKFAVNCMNTVALGYHRQKKYDSAFIFYNKALESVRQVKDTAWSAIWVGIISGNMGQIFYAQEKYDTAYTLLTRDYITSKRAGLYDNAGNSLQWVARTDLAMGNKLAALAEVRAAFQLLKMWPDAGYLRNAYFTATQIFRQMGAYDSAFYYNNLWSVVNDSLEKVVASNSLAITKARLVDETSRYDIQNLNKEKRSQLLLRNIIILSIIALSVLALLIINRQLLKQKIKIEKSEQDKMRMEQEVASARDQLRMFTQNIVEKTSLIEKLEQQVKDKEATAEQQSIISELSRQTILTEDDWNQFKSLFETIYPGFFIKLKNKFPDITLAEQRTAALTRLHLTTKQMASMLGISVDSIHKARQRLRQRLSLPAEQNLEESIASF
jgi:tetratricopeptide (TPR) repeat protein